MKRFVFLFFSLFLIFENISLNFSILKANAESVEDNKYSYTINSDDTITITGISENKKDIIIPSQYQGKIVKKIGDYAFWNNDCIESVKIDDGIEEIGVSAFEYCTSLNAVVLPENAYIYHNAFRNCPKLMNIYIPRGIKLEEHIVNEKNAYTVFGYLDVPIYTGSDAVVEEKNHNFEISGYSYTSAEIYAKENGFSFIELTDDNASGDVNDDGSFGVNDVVMLNKWLLAVPDTHLNNWKAADYNNDNRLDVFDLCLMKRALIESNHTNTK